MASKNFVLTIFYSLVTTADKNNDVIVQKNS